MPQLRGGTCSRVSAENLEYVLLAVQLQASTTTQQAKASKRISIAKLDRMSCFDSHGGDGIMVQSPVEGGCVHDVVYDVEVPPT